MADSPLIHNLELPRTPDGALDLATLNKQWMLFQQRLNALEGRGQGSTILNDLSVLGTLMVQDGIAAESALLGRNGLTPIDPSFAPTVETALTPQALRLDGPLATGADLSAPVSPFTVNVKDEFLGGENTFAAEPGDLGWQFSGVAGFADTASAGHPGVCAVQTTGGTNEIHLNTVFANDIGYVAGIANPSTNQPFRFGLIDNPAAPIETGSGFYFSYDPGSSPLWRTVTGFALDTSFTFARGAWVLMEIVIDAARGTADFYLNRQRASRRTDGTFGVALFPFFAGDNHTFDVDRFVMAGSPSKRIWD